MSAKDVGQSEDSARVATLSLRIAALEKSLVEQTKQYQHAVSETQDMLIGMRRTEETLSLKLDEAVRMSAETSKSLVVAQTDVRSLTERLVVEREQATKTQADLSQQVQVLQRENVELTAQLLAAQKTMEQLAVENRRLGDAVGELTKQVKEVRVDREQLVRVLEEERQTVVQQGQEIVRLAKQLAELERPAISVQPLPSVPMSLAQMDLHSVPSLVVHPEAEEFDQRTMVRRADELGLPREQQAIVAKAAAAVAKLKDLSPKEKLAVFAVGCILGGGGLYLGSLMLAASLTKLISAATVGDQGLMVAHGVWSLLNSGIIKTGVEAALTTLSHIGEFLGCKNLVTDTVQNWLQKVGELMSIDPNKRMGQMVQGVKDVEGALCSPKKEEPPRSSIV